MESANSKVDSLTSNKVSSKKNDIDKSKILNQDIRSFFSKTTGPSILTTNRRIIKVIEPYINEIDEQNYKLRERKIINYKQKFEPSDESAKEDESGIEDELSQNPVEYDEDSSGEISTTKTQKNKKRKRTKKNNKISKKNKTKKKRKLSSEQENGLIYEDSEDQSDNSIENENDSDIDYIELRGSKVFYNLKAEALKAISESEIEIKKLMKEFYINEQKISETKSKYPDMCIPISADIREFKFKNFADKHFELTGKYFDVIMMDPPWQLSSSQPTRGVAIAYDTLNDNIITDIPIEKLQTDGFIFIWTINAKYKTTLDLIKQWGYKYCDEIVWVKQTVNGKIAKGHGYYLQHTKETCLIGIKGHPKYTKDVFCDIIFSKRRGQSQKPEEIYDIVEKLCPNSHYLEIFGRRNNLRDFWVTIGNEI